MLGQLAATLVDDDLTPGTYMVTLDAGNFPAGVYIYRIRSGHFAESKQMLVLK
jgi:hypothetical protein